MGTIIEYLNWRGDLAFTQDPLNDIDTLILSMLSYLPFKGIVPGLEAKSSISLENASAQYFSTAPNNILHFLRYRSSFQAQECRGIHPENR